MCVFTLGGAGLGTAGVVAAPAGVQRAAEALVVEDREGVRTHAGLVVELPTMQHCAAAHHPLPLLTGEAHVHP